MKNNTLDDLSINTITLGWDIDLVKAIRLCLSMGIKCLSTWRHQIHAVGIKKFNQIVKDEGLYINGLCRGGMFTASTGKKYQNMLDDNYRAIDEAAELEADHLVLVVGGITEGNKNLSESHALVQKGINDILEHANKSSIKLAIEPLHPMYAADRGCINTVKHALVLCKSLNNLVGIIIDVYHIWWDMDLKEQIAIAGNENLLYGFHINDWLRNTSDLLYDRGMPGDGVIDINSIWKSMIKSGYDNKIEIEILSKNNWWEKPMAHTLQTCITRYQKLSQNSDSCQG